MPNVNVTSETLRSQLSELKQAAEQVAAARLSIVQRYQQVSGQWNDSKSRDFGAIVNESNTALRNIEKVLLQGQKSLALILKAVIDYEKTSLSSTGSFSGQSNSFTQNPSVSISTSSSGNGDPDVSADSSFGSGGLFSFISSAFSGNSDIYEALKEVEHKTLKPATTVRTEQEVIDSISGGDMTEGSCSSLALAYAGNRAGYIVFDFRDGVSRDVFSRRSSIEQIARLNGVSSTIMSGTDDTIVCMDRLLPSMESGREYYLATGEHAAIVRMSSGGNYQYLELQSGIPEENGWQPLTLSSLYNRFGCFDGRDQECSSYLISLDSLQASTEFLDLLGYINTDESLQMRGVSGHVR